MAVIDHLVLAVPDLDVAIDGFDREHGVRPAVGGRHEGLGTHNALVSLGESYLELIAPDPTQPDPSGPRPFGVDEVTDATLVAWAVRPDPERGETLDGLIERCRSVGHDPGPAIAMSRQTPDGSTLHWQLTFPTMAGDGLVPFFIAWGDTPHPAATAPRGLTLESFDGATEDPDPVNELLRALDLPTIASPIADRGRGLHAAFRASPTP
jgi:hypothetical protein